MAFSTNRPMAYDYQGRVVNHDDAKDQVWRNIDDMERNPAFDTFDAMDRKAARYKGDYKESLTINLDALHMAQMKEAKIAAWAESDKATILAAKRSLGDISLRFRMLVSSILEKDSNLQHSIFEKSGLVLNDLWSFNLNDLWSFNIAGGAPASMLLDEIPNDIDMYFYGPKCAEVLRLYRFIFTKYITDHPSLEMVSVESVIPDDYGKGERESESDADGAVKAQARQLEALEASNSAYAYVTDNAISLAAPKYLGSLKFQIITMQSGDPEDIVKSYDFRHCQAYYNALEDKFTLSKEIYNCIMERKLVVVPEHPGPKKIGTRRIRKYLDRGYTLKEPYALGLDHLLDPAMTREEIEDVLKRYDTLSEKMEVIISMAATSPGSGYNFETDEMQWQTETRVRFEPKRKGVVYDITP